MLSGLICSKSTLQIEKNHELLLIIFLMNGMPNSHFLNERYAKECCSKIFYRSFKILYDMYTILLHVRTQFFGNCINFYANRTYIN